MRTIFDVAPLDAGAGGSGRGKARVGANLLGQYRILELLGDPRLHDGLGRLPNPLEIALSQ